MRLTAGRRSQRLPSHFNTRWQHRVNQHLVLAPPPSQPIHAANWSQEALGVGSLTVRRRERAGNDGWMHGRKEGREGEWESWELAGTTRLLFSFHSSFAHHVFRCRPEQLVVCVFSLAVLPSVLLCSRNPSPAGSSLAHAVSRCLFAMLSVCCMCVCVCREHTHTHTCSSLRTLTNSQWTSMASFFVRTSGSGHFAVSSRCTLT